MATSEPSVINVEKCDIVCSPCKRKGSKTIAAKYCADCSDYYCTNCVSAHDNFPALSGHKLIHVDELKKSEKEVISVVPTDRCERHNYKPVDMYCENHDTVGCNTCMVVEHRSCHDVFYVPEYVLDHDPTNQCEKVQKEMTDVNEDINRQLKIRQEEIKRLVKRKVEEVEKIKQYRVDINQKLDVMEKKSIDTIEENYKAVIKMFEDEITKLTTFQNDVNSSKKDMKCTSGNVSQQFVGGKVANLVTEKAVQVVKQRAKEFTRNDIVFECKQNLPSMIDEMDNFGDIIEKPAFYKLEDKREINITHESDSRVSDIRSICKLNDESVIIADSANQNLKRLDGSSFEVVEVCKLPNSPWQICRVDEEIAVSSWGTNITFVTTEDKLKVAREMETDHRCYGIGYKNEMIYVTDSNQSIFVYNKTGTKLAQYHQDHSGQKLFSSIYSLTVSQDGEKIYVADKGYGLVVLSKNGELQGKYKPSKLLVPWEICESESGDIIVCGESSNNIIQFSPKGEMVGEILQSDNSGKGCWSVCYDGNSSRLIVGRSDNDSIEVYNMI